jgi:hypothetical protein
VRAQFVELSLEVALDASLQSGALASKAPDDRGARGCLESERASHARRRLVDVVQLP